MKTAIVTGGTKGIGYAIADQLLQSGYKTIVNYASDNSNAQKVLNEWSSKYGGHIYVLHHSMETEDGILDYINNCKSLDLFSSGIDAIILNAGCTDRTAWSEMTWDQWMHVMNVNINAPAALLRHLDLYLNNGASVLFISSDMSIYPHAVSVPYTVSKAAVNGLTIALVKEYADRGIRVNALLPGFVDTPWQKKKDPDQRQRICEKVALHRFAEPNEIAKTAIDVLQSTYINGSLIKIDGGYCYK